MEIGNIEISNGFIVTLLVTIFAIIYVKVRAHSKVNQALFNKGKYSDTLQVKRKYGRHNALKYGILFTILALCLLFINVLIKNTGISVVVIYFSMIFLLLGAVLVLFNMPIQRN